MTDTKSDTEIAADKAGDLLGDLLPVIGFIVVYNLMRIFPGEDGGWFAKDKALYWATGVLMIGTAWAVFDKKRQGKKIPPIMIITAMIVGGFGTLGIVLQSPEFLYVKPTIQNLFLASLIFGGLLMGKNLWKLMFKDVFQLPDFAWRTLAHSVGVILCRDGNLERSPMAKFQRRHMGQLEAWQYGDRVHFWRGQYALHAEAPHRSRQAR